LYAYTGSMIDRVKPYRPSMPAGDGIENSAE
jgi:hypothetical protein